MCPCICDAALRACASARRWLHTHAHTLYQPVKDFIVRSAPPASWPSKRSLNTHTHALRLMPAEKNEDTLLYTLEAVISG